MGALQNRLCESTRQFFKKIANFFQRYFTIIWFNRKNQIMENLGFSADTQNDDQVRVLTVNNGEHLDGNLYKLKKGWVVEFRLGSSLLGHNVDVFTNHPQLISDPFKRCTYYQLPWSHESAFLRLSLAGSFHYYIQESREDHDGKVLSSGYLLVEPELTVGANDDQIPLDCIQCQTVLSKLLGPFSTWEDKLKVSQQSGYNMIHFTPIQVIGASKSAYSISDHLNINPSFHDFPNQVTSFDDIDKLIRKIRKEWKVLSICDIVLNHVANESPILLSNPECAYNCINSPHLRPAYLLDAILFDLTLQTSSGELEDKGIPSIIENEDHLNSIRHALHTYFLPQAKIYELYTADIDAIVSEFLLMASKCNRQRKNADSTNNESISIIRDVEYRRLKATIDMDLALKLYNISQNDCLSEDDRLKQCSMDLKKKLQELNDAIIKEVEDHLNAAVENVIAGIRYFRVQTDGPKLKEVSEKHPLVSRYFTDFGSPKSFTQRESIMYSDYGRHLMAHNGWVMNSDPFKNFADSDSNIYLRRELIAWGDSVKLRYGDDPRDCTVLWDYMQKYVLQVAKIFDGIRLDNCHSTPIHVAEYMLDSARAVKPDLYVAAELFTNSDQKDNIFVNRLGITSLIREAMSAWDSHEEGRLIYRFGGDPVGAFIQPRHCPLVPGIAHALFLDQTHDNPTPVEKRSVFDLLPSAALVSMACCASGSNRGYDEMIPHHIHVVDEERQYTSWIDNEDLVKENEKYVSFKSALIPAKKALNDLHFWLGQNTFSQVFVDQIDEDIVAITRHSPTTHQSVVLVAFTVFKHPDPDANDLRRNIRPLRVEGVVEEIILEASLIHERSKGDGKAFCNPEKYKRNRNYINGYSEYIADMKEHIQICNSSMVEKVDSGDPKITQLNFINFQPGSVFAIRVSLHANIRPALEKLNDVVSTVTSTNNSELHTIISRMDFADLNKALYRCDQEERDETANKFGVYNIPGYGPLVYAGLQGIISLLAEIRSNNDLGHPLCINLRQGNWLIDYIWQRLNEDRGTADLGKWLEQATEPFKLIPRYLVPCYFDVIVVNIYSILIERCFSLMSSFIKEGTDFTRLLSLVSIQMGGIVKSAQLPDLSPNLEPPRPKVREVDGKREQECSTMSAGLPHFAVGYVRNWGRDTFIALRGLLLLTNRYEEARYIILGYAGTLRHGLIPNLLDKGANARFNCRDAVWWWFYTIQCYIKEVPDGLKILSDTVTRLFPTDDSPALPAGEVEQPLQDVMQEALSVHFQGLTFRERNAGKQIDEHMTDRGFNNQIGVSLDTGFVFGGNDANCGTWMDKMGSSEKAGNNGKPATPRDGSAVEIVGLSYSTLDFLAELYKQNLYPYGSVQRKEQDGTTVTWSYKQWADKIKENFEFYYYIDEVPREGELRPDLINRRGIYKDTHGATQAWGDYQLRPNFPIAMIISPDLFEPRHAWTALKNAQDILLGPLGMKTLDPSDWAYNGYYNNANDSDDPKVANGWNYHQGPEWLWPLGYFLRARLHFAALVGGEDELKRTVSSTEAIISKHLVEASTNQWRGLPELTNKNGEYCSDSCRTQAWSGSALLEVMYELDRLKRDLKDSKSDYEATIN
ncbi:PREDICTED: glycogen debranching enzyme [Ceratosolen solmsi marchali]|uniref:Glycogen debranching enzyme n=1 Tax=Ceratosolen solmsi marchali TaxID=326594 RepID=A0AAJ6YBN6_9HYME|nr:PREDICTED: glycogen debranching enzyme [Ceratosolen solmsi marchali]